MGAFTSRAVEQSIVDYALTESSVPSGRVSVGLVTGPRTYRLDAILSQGVIPRIESAKADEEFPSVPVQLNGSWVERGTINYCLTEGAVPPSPPPPQLPLRVLLVACSDVDALPPWVMDDAFCSMRTLPVGPLTLFEAHEAVESDLGGPVDPVTAYKLAALAGFADEPLSIITAECKNSGALARLDGTWSLLADPIESAVIPYLKAQLASVSEEYAHVMFHLALLEPFSLAELPADQIKTVSALVRAGEIHRRRDGLYEFIAPAGAIALRELAPTEAHEGAYLPSLESTQPSARAILWASPRELSLDFTQVERAATLEAEHGKWQQVTHLVGGVMEGSAWDRTEPVARGRLLTLSAVAWRFLGDTNRAQAFLEAAGSALDSVTNPGVAADFDGENLVVRQSQLELAAAAADLQHYGLGDAKAAMDSLSRSGVDQTDPRLLAHTFIHRVVAGDVAGAQEISATKGAPPKSLPDWAASRSAVAAVFLLISIGQPTAALQRARQLGTGGNFAAASGGSPLLELQVAAAVAALAVGGPQLYPQLEALVDGRGSEPTETDLALRHTLKALWELAGGSVCAAHHFASCALDAAQNLDPAGVEVAALALVAQTAALLGKRAVAAQRLQELEVLSLKGSGLIGGTVDACVAAAKLLIGVPSAAEQLRNTSAVHIRAGRYGFASDVLYAGIRFGKRRAARDLLRISEHLDGENHRMRLNHAEALLKNDALALVVVAEELESAGLHLYAAEVAASALRLGSLPESLRNRATLWVSVISSKQKLGAHPLLKTGKVVGADSSLTPRELEISQLIHSGLSNAEIAAELGITVRTVEGHITRIYRKTGGTRRKPRRG